MPSASRRRPVLGVCPHGGGLPPRALHLKSRARPARPPELSLALIVAATCDQRSGCHACDNARAPLPRAYRRALHAQGTPRVRPPHPRGQLPPGCRLLPVRIWSVECGAAAGSSWVCGGAGAEEGGVPLWGSPQWSPACAFSPRLAPAASRPWRVRAARSSPPRSSAWTTTGCSTRSAATCSPSSTSARLRKW